jgi:hypothetical protein
LSVATNVSVPHNFRLRCKRGPSGLACRRWPERCSSIQTSTTVYYRVHFTESPNARSRRTEAEHHGNEPSILVSLVSCRITAFSRYHQVT